LEAGDLIISADDVSMTHWQQWVDYVQARPNTPIQLLIERNGSHVSMQLTPASVEKDGKTIGKIGAGVSVDKTLRESMTVYYAMPVWDALSAAVDRTGFYAMTSLKMMGKMLVGTASVSNLSGPISIAQYAGQSAEMGFTAFLKFLGLVSVSLGVLNLLPIPVLDGGHLLFFVIEALKGSPVSDKVQLHFQQMGMALLLSLMLLAMVLDLDRLFQ
jgi:regulator of sigma E protease